MTSKITPGKIFLLLVEDEGILEEIKLLVLAQPSEHHDKRDPERKGQARVRKYGVQDAGP